MATRSRIKSEYVDIDYATTQAFFEARGAQDYASPLSATMYQDNEPVLVEQRDRAEKNVLGPQLYLTEQCRVLDIGCGVGRWAWFLREQVGSLQYLGIDFSTTLVEKAQVQAQARGMSDLQFQVMSAIDISPEQLELAPPYSLVILSGLLIYLNDQDCIKVLRMAGQLCAPGGQLYLREPVGVGGRLTLNRFFSDELNNEYSAIYRTIEELDQLLAKALPAGGFSVDVAQFLFSEPLEKRAETRQYYTVLRKA